MNSKAMNHLLKATGKKISNVIASGGISDSHQIATLFIGSSLGEVMKEFVVQDPAPLWVRYHQKTLDFSYKIIAVRI